MGQGRRGKSGRYRLVLERPGVVYDHEYRTSRGGIRQLAKRRLAEGHEEVRPHRAVIQYADTSPPHWRHVETLQLSPDEPVSKEKSGILSQPRPRGNKSLPTALRNRTSAQKHDVAIGNLAVYLTDRDEIDKKIKKALRAYFQTFPDEKMRKESISELDELSSAEIHGIATTQIIIHEQRKRRWYPDTE